MKIAFPYEVVNKKKINDSQIQRLITCIAVEEKGDDYFKFTPTTFC